LLDFSTLVVGNEYDRPYLANLWGYQTYNAISRGVITPRGENHVILFITKEKQVHLTQYEDRIEQDILFWEGEEKHGADNRISSRRDTIHVFFREKHHSPFVYQGRAILVGFQLNTVKPSKFTFRLIDKLVTTQSIVEEVRASYQLSNTEKEAIIKSRRGQGIYRMNAIQLWKACSVTGFSKENILIASHIKPWKISVNAERIDHFNSLLLVPSLDKLFDKGYIGFETNGKITISGKIKKADLERIGVNNQMRLRQIPHETKNYLAFHQEYRFDILNH
jgi:putative restriction endonuclease